MLINKKNNKDKKNYLAHKYIELVNNGVKPNQILVILLNSYKKAYFTKELKLLNSDLKDNELNICTFWGLCYNAFNDNWQYISSLIESNNEVEKPNLCGLEISQFIFKQSIKEANFSDYISKVNLLHQLFRRYSLIVQNDLSNQEVAKRSKILKESFYLDAQKAIDDYKLKTIQYKSFDYLRQIATLPLIYKNTDYFKDIKYLIVDDADEFSYAFWQFVDAIIPNLKDYFIAYDSEGSTRCGYLCAYKSGISEFKKNYNPEEIVINDKATFENEAKIFYLNLKKGEKTKFNNITSFSSVRRLDMINSVVEEIRELRNKGVKTNEIAIITPIIDEVLTESLSKIDFQVISGNEKLVNIDVIKYILTILKIANNLDIEEYELKHLLIKLFKIPFKKCYEVVKLKRLNSNAIQNDNYTKFISLLNSLQTRGYSLSEQIKIIYENLIKQDSKNYEFLLKEATSFELAFKDIIKNTIEQFIIQIENSVISENPAETTSINNNSVLVGTPQKIIDFSLNTKYQLWLDISNSEWLKEDKGTLYNAWVLNRDWDKDEFTLEDNIELTRDKTARIARKLMLCADKEIKFFSSLYDNEGNENFGGLSDFIEIEKEQKSQPLKIIPREDQKPVLEYKKGRMGIMAVPGAGKTTILLALITKLIQEGTKPENIFVLTYMESAAKNFKERIKSALPDTIDTPNISTIHGLALRIIKENANYTKIGLDSNFEICDDNAKERIIKELLQDEDKFENYLKCLSIVKLSGKEELTSKHKEIQDFFNFYKQYNSTLKQHNLIDYDDMLYYAVKILETDKEVLKYYQNICKYIIEDEAQDSSAIQQKLLDLLSGKHKNLVRCGDINQAITSTFTNSDTQGFKDFLNNSQKVEMNSSQRCAKQIYGLANKLINTSIQEEDLKSAFYKIEMKGTSKNPQTDKKPSFLFFEDEASEKNFILEKIKEIIKDEPNASIAILSRLNSQVNDYNEFFLSNGIKTVVRTDCLAQKRIFKLIFAMLKVIQKPLNNKEIIELAQHYSTAEDIEFLKNLKEQFIKLSPDELSSESLLQLYWDIDYWLNQSTSKLDEIALKIGLFYSKNSTDKANTYLVSTLIKRLNAKPDELINQLEYISQKPLSSYKFFDDENIQNENNVSIMTMHKSKGDEFDYVFIPQMNEDNYPLSKENIKLKGNGHFVQTIKSIIEETPIKTPDTLKQEQANETLRLIYVGITRGKKGLYVTSAKKNKRNKPIKTNELLEKIFLE